MQGTIPKEIMITLATGFANEASKGNLYMEGGEAGVTRPECAGIGGAIL